MSKVIVSNDVKKSDNLNEIALSLLRGDTVLFTDGCDCAIIFSTKGWKTRGIAEPDMFITIFSVVETKKNPV